MGRCQFGTVKNFREDEPDGTDVSMKYLIASDPICHGSRVARVYKACWKVEEHHRTSSQNLGLGNHHGHKLRGVIAHLVTVALAQILAVFMRACLPALKDANTGEVIRHWICICHRISRHGGKITVLVDRELPFSDAVYHYQLARAGLSAIPAAELL